MAGKRTTGEMRRFLAIVAVILAVIVIATVAYSTIDGVSTLVNERNTSKDEVLREAESIVNVTLFNQSQSNADPQAVARRGQYFNLTMFQDYAAGNPTMIFGLVMDIFAPLYGINIQLITQNGQVVASQLPEGIVPEDFPPPQGSEQFQTVDQIGPLHGHFIAWYLTMPVPGGPDALVTWIIDRTDQINAIDSRYNHAMSSLIIREVSVGGGILVLSLLVVFLGIAFLSRKYIVSPMNAMQDQLLRAERLGALGELAGSVSHEMRNPLNVIRSSAFYLRGRLGDTDEKVSTHLDRMERSVERADNIINDLLSYSKITTTLHEETDVKRLAETIISEMKVPEGVNVAVQAPAGLPAFRVDPILFGQVLNNLVQNSFQAMPQGGTVEVGLAEEGGQFKTTVRDDGEGISAENLPRVFEPLFSTKAVGTGFGLAVCRRIVEEQGGTIGIESTEGKGTTVTVRLPLKGGQ